MCIKNNIKGVTKVIPLIYGTSHPLSVSEGKSKKGKRGRGMRQGKKTVIDRAKEVIQAGYEQEEGEIDEILAVMGELELWVKQRAKETEHKREILKEIEKAQEDLKRCERKGKRGGKGCERV